MMDTILEKSGTILLQIHFYIYMNILLLKCLLH